jgi:hypothetical protein
MNIARKVRVEAQSDALQEQQAFRGYLDLELKNVAARGPENCGQRRRDERALRMVEFARDATIAPRAPASTDARTAAHVDAVWADGFPEPQDHKVGRSRAQSDEQANLKQLQLEMMNLYAELDRVRTAASTKRAAAENFARRGATGAASGRA